MSSSPPLIQTDSLLLFVSAFELPIAVFLVYLLVRIVMFHVGDTRGLLTRVTSAFHPGVQGTHAHDLVIAFLVIYVGKILRIESTWEWLFFELTDFPRLRLTLGVFITAVGSVCLIRLLSSRAEFRWYWVGVILFALAFATASVNAGSIWSVVARWN